jgi:hypothetical protein
LIITIRKKNIELKKLIPKNWEHKESKVNCIKNVSESKSTGIFSSATFYKPKYIEEVRHYIYKKIGQSNVNSLLTELDKIYDFLKKKQRYRSFWM